MKIRLNSVTTVIALVFVTGSQVWALPSKNCVDLISKKLKDRSQASAGARIEIIESKTWMTPGIHGCLFMSNPGGALFKTSIAAPGERFEILDSPRKIGEMAGLSLKAKRESDSQIGYFYWSDIRFRSAVIISGQLLDEAPPEKVKPPKLTSGRLGIGERPASDTNYYGRKLALVDELVFVGRGIAS